MKILLIIAVVGIVVVVVLVIGSRTSKRSSTGPYIGSNREVVRAALVRLITRPLGSFVIIEDVQSGKFVQFAGSNEEPLLLDLPSQTLSPEEMKKATAVFLEMGYAGPETYQTQAFPGGPPSGEQTSFTVKFERDVDKATELGVAILHRVYGLDENARLELTEE